VDIENAWFDIRQELPKLRDKHQRVIALFTQNGCTIDDVESCVDLLRDERLRVEFNDILKDFQGHPRHPAPLHQQLALD
jgi:type I restriction enzyme R subunit